VCANKPWVSFPLQVRSGLSGPGPSRAVPGRAGPYGTVEIPGCGWVGENNFGSGQILLQQIFLFLFESSSNQFINAFIFGCKMNAMCHMNLYMQSISASCYLFQSKERSCKSDFVRVAYGPSGILTLGLITIALDERMAASPNSNFLTL
jgi:hypothetical protein